MLILLPPSESKSQPQHGEPVELGELSFPGLTEAREAMLERLVEVSAGERAQELLKVGPRLQEEVLRNTRLRELPAAGAFQVYTGVLYDALDHASLDSAAQERADRSLLVVSALWGLLGPTDRIPAYRLSMGARLAPRGTLGAWWKGELSTVLDPLAEDQLVVDCRSGAYQTAWQAPAGQTVQVRAERLEQDGTRRVVSHMAKHYRGLLARWLLEQEAEPRNADELQDIVQARFTAELEPATARKPAQLTLLVPEKG